MKKVLTSLTALAIIVTAMGICSANAAILQVNLSLDANSPDEAGFTNWLSPDKTEGATTTINGFSLSATPTASDADGMRVIDRGARTGTLSDLTETWWGTKLHGGVFTIGVGGLAAGDYEWTSWHRDHDNQYGQMTISLSEDGGTSFSNVTTVGIVSGTVTDSPNPATFGFSANGTDDVFVRFTKSAEGDHNQEFTVVNGFEVVVLSYAPPAGTVVIIK